MEEDRSTKGSGSRVSRGHELAVRAEEAFANSNFAEAGQLHQQAAQRFSEAAASVTDDVTKSTLTMLATIQEGRARDALDKPRSLEGISVTMAQPIRSFARGSALPPSLETPESSTVDHQAEAAHLKGVAAGLLEGWHALSSLLELLPSEQTQGAAPEFSRLPIMSPDVEESFLIVRDKAPAAAPGLQQAANALTPVAAEAMQQLKSLLAPVSATGTGSENEARVRRELEAKLLDSTATVRKLVLENQQLKEAVDQSSALAEENANLWRQIHAFQNAVQSQGRHIRTTANSILLDPQM